MRGSACWYDGVSKNGSKDGKVLYNFALGILKKNFFPCVSGRKHRRLVCCRVVAAPEIFVRLMSSFGIKGVL